MSVGRKCRLGVLLSGRGSNFEAILKVIAADSAYPAEVAVVVSNCSQVGGLAIAEARGIPAVRVKPSQYASLEAYDEVVLGELRRHAVDVVVLAGYTKILSPVLLNAFAGRILNIHPSLLPAYGGHGMWGERVHAAVLAAGETQSGCTVHQVIAEVDAGPILGQARVDVLPGDTPETLAARILAQEHRLYPEAIRRFILETWQNHEPQGASSHDTNPLPC